MLYNYVQWTSSVHNDVVYARLHTDRCINAAPHWHARLPQAAALMQIQSAQAAACNHTHNGSVAMITGVTLGTRRLSQAAH